MIPVWSYLKEYEYEKKHIHSAIEKVLLSGRLILGEGVAGFEREFSAYCSSRHGIGVGNGTDALFIALKALGIGAGDEVITVPNTAIPTVSAICATGATPVFVDVEKGTLLMDPKLVLGAITKKTKCILPVHLYGQCCQMDAINGIANAHGLKVLEDCAQAHGAKWGGRIAGSMSDISAFSFYPTKILGTYGDAGMVVTNSGEIAKKARMLRMYGMEPGGDYYAHMHGYNTRLDELHAEILRFKLTQISKYIKKRKEIAGRYYKGLKGMPLRLQEVNPKADHAYYLFVCMHPERDRLLSELKKQDIVLNVSYKYPIHTMEAYKFLGYSEGDFPITEEACRTLFSLPMYPGLSGAEQKKVMLALRGLV